MTVLPSPVAEGLVEWAERTPHRTALTDAQRSYTFAEVEQCVAARAAALAATVRDSRAHNGDGSNTPWVPVLLDRTAESALAILTFVHAGVPFVPLDHTTPPERMRNILGRLGSPRLVVLAHKGLRNAAADALPSLVLNETDNSTTHLEPQPLDHEVPAFVVFTSGSTGRPKAVVRRWTVFANRMEDQRSQWMCVPGEEWNTSTLQPFSFAPGYRGLAGMALGRAMHIIDPSTVSTDALVRWFNDRRIHEATLTATLLRSILESVDGDLSIPSIRLVRLSSEASNWDLVRRIRRFAAPDVTVFTGYSASETGRTFLLEIRSTDAIGEGPIPLGVPLNPSNIRLEAVDGDPSTTQLVVRTDESLGYLDDPELLAARYRSDEEIGLPHRADAGVWWSSGDIAVVDESGMYHHRGRIDDMVKINGLLVEPAESERALRALPGITAAAVLPHQLSSGKYRLVAHIVVDDDALTPEAVRASLRALLPRHLVPAVLVRHESLPVNERIKLDREGLRTQPIVRWRTSTDGPIYDETVRWVAARVGDIVELDDIAADDDIWDVGLDSLGAVELCAMIADAGLGDIEPPQLLTSTTPAQIAALVRSAVRKHRPRSAVALNANGTNDPVFVVPGGGGTALAFRSLAQELGADQPLVIVEPRGLHDGRIPDHSIATMGKRIADEVCAGPHRLREGAPCVLIGYSAGATIAFEAAHQLIARGIDVHLVFLDATVRGRGIPSDRTAPQPTAASFVARRGARTASELVTQSPAIALRLAQRMWKRTRTKVETHLVYRPWERTTPGDPHYVRFGALIGRASMRYRPVRLPAPITVIESGHVGRGERTRRWATSVTTLRCGGDHYTVLEPPHVEHLAAMLTGIASSARATPDVHPHGR